MTQKEASTKIAALIKEAEAKIAEAEKVSNESGIDFSWSGPDYGMGGHYTAKSNVDKPEGAEEDWEPSDSEYGWNSSSSFC